MTTVDIVLLGLACVALLGCAAFAVLWQQAERDVKRLTKAITNDYWPVSWMKEWDNPEDAVYDTAGEHKSAGGDS